MGQAIKNHPADPVLWSRIQGAHLPIERDGCEFHQHLAALTELCEAEARALEFEYRRFLYLAARADGRREPPALVRLAWDYHAGLDAGYAEDFCPHVLGVRRILRAAPGEASPAYAATCADYRTEFGKPPPAAIWPEPELPASPPVPGVEASVARFA